ncbi:MAG TPA: ABC transporter ATP-binding protein, partial [Thermotogota bacterium]|nr:ABC transporter ATP-binding protein [Thermotogota bacterium]
SLARSLIVQPAVLLLDEPLSNLDALLREQMRVEIRRIQQSFGITAVYVTHDRVEAMSLSDQIIVMNAGKIVQIGSPEEIYEKPNSKFVAGFIGKVAFFPVQVQETGKEKCVVKINDKVFDTYSYVQQVQTGQTASMMCRPESMKPVEPGEGILDGVVRTNIYLGNSVESFINTEFGEVLVQIDNPAQKKIYHEGEKVSIAINPALARVLPQE